MELSNTTEQPKQDKKIKFKKLKFVSERIQLLHTVLQILNINEQNNTFDSFSLDDNRELQMQILALDNEFQKYFMVSKWPAYSNNDKIVNERRYLSMIKSMLKEMGIKIESLSMKKKYNNRTINTTAYKIDMSTVPSNVIPPVETIIV